MTEGLYAYLIATPEKALCDKLYSITPVRNKKELQVLLFEDLRIDETGFAQLDQEFLTRLCGTCHCTNLNLLQKLLR